MTEWRWTFVRADRDYRAGDLFMGSMPGDAPGDAFKRGQRRWEAEQAARRAEIARKTITLDPSEYRWLD